MIDVDAIILMLCLMLGGLEAVAVVNHHSDDEYYLEHEVPRAEALAEAMKHQIYSGPILGCKPCTNSEMTYCADGSVMDDHCSCDANEIFPFVEHTCRQGPEKHKVHAGDCAEYTRLRECCCHSYLVSIWKSLANGTGARVSASSIKSFLLFLTVLGLHLLST